MQGIYLDKMDFTAHRNVQLSLNNWIRRKYNLYSVFSINNNYFCGYQSQVKRYRNLNCSNLIQDDIYDKNKSWEMCEIEHNIHHCLTYLSFLCARINKVFEGLFKLSFNGHVHNFNLISSVK